MLIFCPLSTGLALESPQVASSVPLLKLSAQQLEAGPSPPRPPGGEDICPSVGPGCWSPATWGRCGSCLLTLTPSLLSVGAVDFIYLFPLPYWQWKLSCVQNGAQLMQDATGFHSLLGPRGEAALAVFEHLNWKVFGPALAGVGNGRT